MRPTYETLIEQIGKQRSQVIKTKLGWRDYLTRQRFGVLVFLTGLTLTTLSGRTFANRFMDILEEFGENRSHTIQTAVDFQDYESIERQTKTITNNLETSAYCAIGGAATAGIGYLIVRWKPREQWSSKINKYKRVIKKQHKNL